MDPCPSLSLLYTLSPLSAPFLFRSFFGELRRAKEKIGGRGAGDFLVIIIITIIVISAKFRRCERVAQIPLFYSFFSCSETEGAVRRGQKDEKVESALIVNIWVHGGEVES